MKLYRKFSYLVTAQLLWGAVALGQGYKAENIGAPPAADIPQAVRDLLDSQGTRVVNGQGATVLETWLVKRVPSNPSPGASSDILYGALSEGTFLGVLHFPSTGADFRGQAIKPGFYTMRYALIPQDGNHMGVNPYRDAIVLGPVSADTQPNTPLRYEALVKLSTQASGTPHPAILVMAQAGGDSVPSIVKDDQGHWNLHLKAHGQNGDLSIALTVVGKWEG